MEYLHGGDVYTYEGMTDYSANINPLGPNPAVLKAAQNALGQMDRYPDAHCRKLCQGIAEKFGCEKEEVICGNGASDLIFQLVQAEKPQKALLLAPSFVEYRQALQSVDCRIQNFELKEEDKFHLSEVYLDCLTNDLDMIFLCSPANPVGDMIEKKLLLQILEICRSNQIRMIIDECFIEFCDSPDAASLVDQVKYYPELFVLRAFTKIHAIPGLRLGYGICRDKNLLAKMQAVRQPWSVSGVAQAAGLAALKETQWEDETRAYVSRERAYMTAEFDRIGVQYYLPAANYIFLKSSIDLYQCLKDKNLLIRDCGNYDGLTSGYYRVAVRSHDENQTLIQALRQIYQDRNPED